MTSFRGRKEALDELRGAGVNITALCEAALAERCKLGKLNEESQQFVLKLPEDLMRKAKANQVNVSKTLAAAVEQAYQQLRAAKK